MNNSHRDLAPISEVAWRVLEDQVRVAREAVDAVERGAHDAESIDLYIEESSVFRVHGAEAGVALTAPSPD
ncbi:hypothetical protein [Salinifilum ghardaiensis]